MSCMATYAAWSWRYSSLVTPDGPASCNELAAVGQAWCFLSATAKLVYHIEANPQLLIANLDSPHA